MHHLAMDHWHDVGRGMRHHDTGTGSEDAATGAGEDRGERPDAWRLDASSVRKPGCTPETANKASRLAAA